MSFTESKSTLSQYESAQESMVSAHDDNDDNNNNNNIKSLNSQETLKKENKNNSLHLPDYADNAPSSEDDIEEFDNDEINGAKKFIPIPTDQLNENLKLSKTISLRSSHHDYTDPEKFRNEVQNSFEDEYEDELLDEIKRVVTNHSKLSKFLTGSNNIDLENKNQIDDPEIVGYEVSKVDWDGPNDPDCPNNWPTWKKWYCTMTTAFLCLVITLGSSIYVDAIPEMMLKWKISQTLGLAGLTFYLLGLAFGPAFAAPLSELFGRKVVYCTSLPISMLFIMGVGLSPNIGSVLVLRCFSGLTSSGALAIAGGTITDIWLPHEIGIAMTLFCLAPLAGPVIGPIIGGFVCENKISNLPHRVGGLRWAMWVNLFFAATVFIPLFLMPETYKPIIMRKRLIKRGKKIKKTMSLSQFLVAVVFITLIKPVEMLFVEPIILVFSIYTAFVFAVLFGFFEAFPVIFRGIYKMQLGVSGLPFLSVGIGLLLGAALYVCMDRFIFWKKWDDGYYGMKDKNGNKISPTPESRLLPCMVGSITFGPSLFWLGWTSRESVHWMAPTAAGVLFGFSLVLIFFSILTYFSMAYPPISVASALAANNMTRYIVSSVFPLFTVQMMTNLHVSWGCSVFAFIACAMIPVPWIFSYWGPTLRKRSKYGWTAIAREKLKQENKNNSSNSTTVSDNSEKN